MFEEHNPVLRFIFRHGRGPVGKVAASTIIGGLLLGYTGLKAQKESKAIHWHDFAMVGAAIGLLAGIILVVLDVQSGKDVDDELGGPRRVMSVWRAWVVALTALALLGLIVVGCLWFSEKMKHSR